LVPIRLPEKKKAVLRRKVALLGRGMEGGGIPKGIGGTVVRLLDVDYQGTANEYTRGTETPGKRPGPRGGCKTHKENKPSSQERPDPKKVSPQEGKKK